MKTKIKKTLLTLAITLNLAPPAYAALEASNTVKSSELITDFALIKDASEPEVTSILNLFKVGKDNRGPTLLETSADDVITLSVGDTKVTCQYNQDCRLPYIKGAVYRAELKRNTGEVFSTTTVLPNETKIIAPTENSMFNPDQSIDFSWNVARTTGPRGITLSIFLGEQVTTCSTTGNLDWITEGTAKAPANYVSTCIPPLRARFGVFYVNPVGMPGVAGGTLKGYSTARVFFTYMQSGIRIERNASPLTKEEFMDLIGSAPQRQALSQTVLR